MALVGLLLFFLGGRGPSRAEVERKARELGMGYRNEFLVFSGTGAESRENNPPQVAGRQPEASKAPAGESAVKAPVEEATVEVVIPAGYGPTEVAALLEKQGVAKSQDFLKEVEGRGLARRLRAGKYTLRKGALEEAIRALSGL